MSSPDTEYLSLDEFLRHGWDHLGRGVVDAKHPARTPTLATIAPSGFPAQRTVVLRDVQRADGIVEIHTDCETPKVAELQLHNKASLHIWIRKAMIQLRLDVCFDILRGEQVADRWNVVPPASRISYGTQPVPGQRIKGPFEYEKPVDQTRFAVLTGRVQRLEILYLGAKHQRAEFTRADDWRGHWMSP